MECIHYFCLVPDELGSLNSHSFFHGTKIINGMTKMFDMIDLTFNNLQQQNKELKRTVNELSSKINKVSDDLAFSIVISYWPLTGLISPPLPFLE